MYCMTPVYLAEGRRTAVVHTSMGSFLEAGLYVLIMNLCMKVQASSKPLEWWTCRHTIMKACRCCSQEHL